MSEVETVTTIEEDKKIESATKQFTLEETMKLFARTILFLLNDETGISVKSDVDGKNYVVFRSGTMINITEEAHSITEGLTVKVTKG